jgi:hypothetical protein
MQTLKAQQKVDSIIQDVTKNGIIAENMIKELKDLREIVRVEQDPLVIKTLRLVYTYIEDEGSFDLNLLEEEEIDEIEEEEEDGIDAEAKEEEEEEEEEIYEFSTVEDFEEKRENFLYFLSLIKESENEYNRKELKKLRSFLWEEIHG